MSGQRGEPQTVRITAGGTDRPRQRRVRVPAAVAAVVLLGGAGVTVAAALGNGNGNGDDVAGAAGESAAAEELRLGYFGNVTHAPALIGVQEGLIAEALDEGGRTQLRTEVFNAGPSAIEALNAGAIDAAYLGPSPAINSFAQSKGEALVVIAGAASGGAQLVVQPGLDGAADLAGTVLATPQLGGTQDVALRSYLRDQGLSFGATSDAEVSINPTENAQTLQLFADDRLDGAWLPEPWASRLVLEAGAEVLVDEAELWDGELTPDPGQFPTTILVVNRDFANAHPDTVEALLRGHVEALDWLEKTPAAERSGAINEALEQSAGAPLPEDVIERSLEHIEFTADPLAGTYTKLLQDGVDVGLTQSADLTGLTDLEALNRVLAEKGDRDQVDSSGSGTE